LNSTAKKQIRLKKVYGIGNNKNIKSLVPHREPYHEFVFFGRSNVGKSTLLNQLLQQAVAGVSKQPGKTKELMFCELNTQYKAMMVDAPGYGFATGTSKKEIN
jgi:GTP-binding protein EngB required for normal cell division